MKEYGNLSLDQFKQIVGDLPQVREQMVQLPELLRNASRQKLDEALGQGVVWADLYEHPFVESVASCVYAMGEQQRIREFADSDDPQQAFLDAARSEEGFDRLAEGVEIRQLVGLVTVLQRNILSIMLYHQTVSDLIEEVRAGDDEALFKAVRIDRSTVACRSIALRISRAELLQEKSFFLHLRSALKGPSKKHWEAYRDLRYSLFLLREMGCNKMSDAELEDLLVHKLKLYSPTPTARKNLRKQFNESKKFATT